MPQAQLDDRGIGKEKIKTDLVNRTPLRPVTLMEMFFSFNMSKKYDRYC